MSALRDAFVQAYRRREVAEDLADRAGLLVGTFPERSNMRDTWTALVDTAGRQGILRRLVQLAAEDVSVAAYRPTFEGMLTGAPALSPPQGPSTTGDWWQGDDLAPAAGERLQLERLMERRSRLVGIELAASVVAAAASVAKLSLRFGTERAFGTGFLIGSDRILTNHHNTTHPDFGALTSAVAEFDFDQAPHDEPLVRVVDIEGTVADAADDWAVLRLAAPVDRAALPLGSPFQVGVDDLVVIIQHPQGGFKQFALEPLAVRFVDDARVQYVADTQQGSSGSPVFNERMHVIAVHHAEAEVTKGKDTWWRNEGIPIARIAAGLRSHGIDFVQR